MGQEHSPPEQPPQRQPQGGLLSGLSASVSSGAAAMRRINISLSPAGLISSLLLLCLGFVGVFSLGILVGRGHNPEAGIPELARIMPEPAPLNAPTVIAEDSGLLAQTPAPAATEGIIDQGNLEYRDHLKTPATQEKARVQETTAARPAPDSAPTIVSVSADTQVYHYSYQAASFRDQPSCDAFSAKLAKAGFKSRTEKVESEGVIWYRVMVDFTGRPDDTNALRDKLKEHGVPKALLRGKSPALP
ncbi:SPOR domain-containing protein [Desulfovibrio sp. OttesenSCG-928-F20]|nr:SPOR domain-containing protein [Desulfovibrio sp. OttesenSCG-928-M16]MDL2291249.1 SPOR domain-containing protein [Desulfovibrio sp. OttesenSCG-928-F20]